MVHQLRILEWRLPPRRNCRQLVIRHIVGALSDGHSMVCCCFGIIAATTFR